MKEMVNLTLRTEYSFQKTFGFAKDLHEHSNGTGYVGVADLDNTFAHAIVQEESKKKGVKAILGVRLKVVRSTSHRIPGVRRGLPGPTYIFLAKTQAAIKEINELVKKAWSSFYYYPIVGLIDVFNLSDEVIVIADSYHFGDSYKEKNWIDARIDYVGVGVKTPKYALNSSLPKVAIQDNNFPHATDRQVYELFAGAQNRKDGMYFNFDRQTYPQHILSTKEWLYYFKDEEAVENTHIIASQCDATLPVAPMVRYNGDERLRDLCIDGARKRGIDLNDEKYAARLKRELDQIDEKDYEDYFLIVTDMVSQAKKKMLVGPSRGSSAGSLVCYLIGITEIDPLKYDLLFERFIDINRPDLPDIDIDFPDDGRGEVIKALEKRYGEENVGHIATISRLKPKSAIGLFSAGLGIPAYETDMLKDSIMKRSSGDARAAMQIMDTFDSTDIGKEFLEKYPNMRIVEKVEQHARHAGVHAAGIIVCNEPLTKFCGINSKVNSKAPNIDPFEDVEDDGFADQKINTIMADKYAIRVTELLKIDVLGLRTLSILQECATLAKFDFHKYYDIDLEDKSTLETINSMRLSGVFQFEGPALQHITRNMGVSCFNDIVAITSLARPGPMHSGGTTKFVSRRIGKSPVEYISDHETYVNITKDTYGIVVYQEQLMRIAREFGDMPWADVAELRRGSAKSLGIEFFNTFKERFIEGTGRKGIDPAIAEEVWENMVTFGSWAFNKSHAVSYALISYWTAWAKTYYPLEFAVANLNHTKNDLSALRLLRDMVENDGIDYISFDKELSDVKWSISNGKIIGGLTSVKGLGVAKARKIVARRNEGMPNTKAMEKLLDNAETIFDILYPCDFFFGHYYDYPKACGLKEAPSYIKDVQKPGEYIVMGRLVAKDIMDLNEYNTRAKRGGEYITDHSLYLKIVIEDDTDRIQCRINRFKYDELNGAYIGEHGVLDETWYIVKGRVRGEWRAIEIDAIVDLDTLDAGRQNEREDIYKAAVRNGGR